MDSSGQKFATHGLQHFYVAAGTSAAKLDSLIELITALETNGPLSLVICCGSRDVLDGVAAALRTHRCPYIWCLHADQSEREVDNEVQSFKRAGDEAHRSSQAPINVPYRGDDAPLLHHQEQHGRPVDGSNAVDTGADQRLRILVMTDIPLRIVNKELLPLAPALLINYDIPVRREDYVRRIAGVLGGRSSRGAGGAPRLTVNFLEAGRVGELKQLEAFAEKEVMEMPVHVWDVFKTGGHT